MKRKEVNSARVPVFRDSGFELYDAQTTADAFRSETLNERDPDIYIYSRYRNPTVVAAEEEVMNLEGCKWALLTQSGMSAVDLAVSIFQRGSATKPWLFFSEIYGGTISFTESVLKKRRGIETVTFTPENEKYSIIDFEKLIKKVKPEFVYIEAIANPMLIVPDAEAIIDIAKKYGSRIIVDNTFATPQLWKPLETGADLVLHSVTKYFSGHGNISAGVLCGNDENLMKEAVEYRKFTGHMLSPDDAYRLSTQIKSFGLRFSRQCENASHIADLLCNNGKIGKVWYPGLKDHPTHNEAVKLFMGRGFGGMVTFEFAGSNDEQRKKRRDQFIKGVSSRIKLIPTLGDPHTILMPVEAVWGHKYPRPGMIRLSAGFEETEDISGFIDNVLSRIE